MAFNGGNKNVVIFYLQIIHKKDHKTEIAFWKSLNSSDQITKNIVYWIIKCIDPPIYYHPFYCSYSTDPKIKERKIMTKTKQSKDMSACLKGKMQKGKGTRPANNETFKKCREEIKKW